MGGPASRSGAPQRRGAAAVAAVLGLAALIPGAEAGPPSGPAIAAPSLDGGSAAPPAAGGERTLAGTSPDAVAIDEDATREANDVRLAPSPRGVLGAWLLAGPFPAGKPALDRAPPGVIEASIAPAVGAKLGSARWKLAASGGGPVDVKAALGPAGTSTDAIAYAAGVLHVPKGGNHLLLLAVDDGVRVLLDGRAVFSRDDPRPLRADHDVVPLDLQPGAHTLVLKLHQHSGAWVFRARVTDGALAPSPGVYLHLPGTTADDARAIAGKMASVAVDRGFLPTLDPPRYRPIVTVSFPEGAPRGVPLPIAARMTVAGKAEALFDVTAGGVPVTTDGAGELVVTLPHVPTAATERVLEVSAAGRSSRASLPARPLTEQALARAARILAKTPEDADFLGEGALESVRFLSKRLAALLAQGDGDVAAQSEEARELDALATALEQRRDPFAGRVGPMRRALRSPIDGEPSELGVYVPSSLRADGSRRYPLVVGLHGLNGNPLGVMRWLFGGDDPKRPQAWEERHVGKLPEIDAFVITPHGHGNTMYRELGETDVMNAVAWAMRAYPIDPLRVTITGMSMGGIGSGGIPLRNPHVFAAAAPLCGYHSYFVRSDVAGRAMRPWERFMAEERSNALWAENGAALPLYVVHGTKDLPVINSGVLIERYEKLGYAIRHEHPEAGHNVWQETYEGLKGLRWLIAHQRQATPARVRFKTTRTRWGTSAWVTIAELAGEAAWGEVDARFSAKDRAVKATTSGVAEIALSREILAVGGGPLTLTLDGQALSFDADEPLVGVRDGATWKKGARTAASPGARVKRGAVTGPLRDVFHEPLLFVYADAPEERRAGAEVARHFATIRGGVRVSYPILSDTEFLARGEALANDRALFLLGRKNRVTAALTRMAPFPITVDEGAVTVGGARITGRELGAAFIHPNPARPDRYVVVMAGADVPGMLRATSLPDLLPDFVVWDEALAPARGQTLLGRASVRAGGFFTKAWQLPATRGDPRAPTTSASAVTSTSASASSTNASAAPPPPSPPARATAGESAADDDAP